MPDKYQLVSVENPNPDQPLFRLKCLTAFSDVQVGQLGGFVDSPLNLSQTGNCWLYDSARAVGNSVVSGNATMRGNTFIQDNVQLSGNARMLNYAYGVKDAAITGSAVLDSVACVTDSAQIGGTARLTGRFVLGGTSNITAPIVLGEADNGLGVVPNNTGISTDAIITTASDLLVLGPALSSGRYTYAYKTASHPVYITVDCFNGTLEQFIEMVRITHQKNFMHPEYYYQYMGFVEQIKTHFSLT